MKRLWTRPIAITILALSTLLAESGCYGFFTSAKAAAITFRGPLKVAIHQDLITRSLEKDLITEFARNHSIKIKLISFESLEQAENLLNHDRVDLIFPRTPSINSDFEGHHQFVYDDLKLSMVCGSPTNNSQLWVPTQYSYILQNKRFLKKFKTLSTVATKTELSAQELLTKTLKYPETCYISDSRIALKQSQNYPQIHILWIAKKSDSVFWVSRNDLQEINQMIHTWFQNLARKKQLRKFWDRYESVEFKMSLLEHRRFQSDIIKKLPRWKKQFEKNARKNQIPWTLLAAVAYQESKWNEDATSHTGVKGLMQLTKDTAKYVGVDDREDPSESIRGGAFYLKYLYDKTSIKLSPYERWAQALSAYNMGWAHLRDARLLAKRLNTDATRWSRFKKILPLLRDKKYHSQLQFGFARGDETVDFVDQVFGYTDLLNSTFTRRSQTSQDF
ncbi:MAG: hypothetical protein A2622_09075 [Bdellovibrionales bacterium RIFCSPHIGHO2_01_FULL_40_29]|nr:MAG: hypothetical protein A2622_09075 [Bdellovibrionales bacterium RIFCSPHIGHO2_01_FULL_40_29]OFZ32884.1 MAG: hypothetical protein A3D17_09285 [Bdellovibrionales bacterium RIFCSPHIGHO2_02_FULL_40_15]